MTEGSAEPRPEEAGTPVFARTVAVYRGRTDEQNWDALLEQAGRVARHDYETDLEDHRKTMELLWEYFEDKGSWLADRYAEARDVRDDTDLGLFVKIYESVNGLV
ncbi:hypothetical protein ACWD4V_15975 [Streptomyces tsukubensis]|uniref:hypothetical protein n=1 Tax=Streptomyces tsukubensis TaxID=83656 RepID=UPI003685ED1B